MTPNEFKAWFDAFAEAFAGCPNKAQWTRIKTRVAEIDGKPVTEKVFVDRYWTRQFPYYPEYRPYWALAGAGVCNAVGINQAQTVAYSAGSNAKGAQKASSNVASFNSTRAMTDLGRADALALKQ